MPNTGQKSENMPLDKKTEVWYLARTTVTGAFILECNVMQRSNANTPEALYCGSAGIVAALKSPRLSSLAAS